jgi:hypothetical protein
MDVNQLIETPYISVELVKNAKDKRVVIIDEGEIVQTKWGTNKLELNVDMNKEVKTWSLNQQTLRNLREAWGNDSKEWVGKIVQLSIGEREGKAYVIGFPI